MAVAATGVAWDRGVAVGTGVEGGAAVASGVEAGRTISARLALSGGRSTRKSARNEPSTSAAIEPR